MKELIIKALNEAFDSLERQVPQTKKDLKHICIDDVEPVELIAFMEKNNVPSDASFATHSDSYLGFEQVLLQWFVDVPTTDKDKLKFRNERFKLIAWGFVRTTLTENGYKRDHIDPMNKRNFDPNTMYEAYINKEFDRFVEYYSHSFYKPC